MNKKLWLRLFWRITAIFTVFVIALAVCNSTLLLSFFKVRQKKLLTEQLTVMQKLDYSDSAAVTGTISDISEKYNFEVEVYSDSGRVIYTTKGLQMMDFYLDADMAFSMLHSPLRVEKSESLSNGGIYEVGTDRRSGKEYLICRSAVSDGLYSELRIPVELLRTSAVTANEFILIISLVCFAAALVWTFWFARKFSRPIAQMNDITKDMAALRFDRRLEVSSNDEIGSLAESINRMSQSLSSSLDELNETNRRLMGEIELERQLDVMRRGFVANVSHELKTPLSIISGYAEGLKMNVNSAARQEYCDTIIDESMRMNRLVLSLLDLSRYESGQAPVNRAIFDVSVMADDMLSRIFRGSRVNVRCDIPDGTLVSADTVQTEQIFKSYLENALAHTPENGEVRIFCEPCEGKLKISVFNTGSSINPEIMPQIWQSFYRGDESHKRDNSRFGLGLSIVSSIIKLTGQQCGVYNTDDGVCFWFTADSGEAGNQCCREIS